MRTRPSTTEGRTDSPQRTKQRKKKHLYQPRPSALLRGRPGGCGFFRNQGAEGAEVEGQALAHPDGALGVVPEVGLGVRDPRLPDGVGVDQRRQRAPVDGEPGDEGAELRRREEVHFFFFARKNGPGAGVWGGETLAAGSSSE